MTRSVEDRVIMYADNTSIISSSRTTDEMCAKMTQSLENAGKYFGRNNLFINDSKTKYMQIQAIKTATTQNLSLKLGDSLLEEVASYKFLGM